MTVVVPGPAMTDWARACVDGSTSATTLHEIMRIRMIASPGNGQNVSLIQSIMVCHRARTEIEWQPNVVCGHKARNLWSILGLHGKSIMARK